MDQPTNIEITITGAKEEVKRAALAAQRRIDFTQKDLRKVHGKEKSKI